LKITSLTFHKSLKYRLLSLLLISLLLLVGITAYSTYDTSMHEMEEILDGQMIVNSRTLFSVIALELEENQFYEVPEFFDNYVRYNTGELGTYYSNNLYDDYDSEFYMQLVDPFGHTVFSSNGTELVKNTRK